MPSPIAFKHGVTERFLRYVVIDTQSDPSSPTCPSTEKQKDLGHLLAAELRAMGLADAHLDAHGPSAFAFNFKKRFAPDAEFLRSIDWTSFQPCPAA